jgi:hypothetical protein
LKKQRLWILICILISAPSPGASEPLDEHLSQAERAYAAGDQALARAWLRSVPGLLSAFPALSPLSKQAEIFLDIAVCHLADKDTASARLSVERAYSLSPKRREGRLSHLKLDPFRRNVVRQLQKVSAATRTRWGAFQRSLVIPGWGQIYRGHKKKGVVLMGLGLGAAAAWVLKYNSFGSARDAYESTTRQDVIGGTFYQNPGGSHYTEFEARHRTADSRASTANKLLGVALAFWSYNILDSIVAGPGYFTLSVDLP